MNFNPKVKCKFWKTEEKGILSVESPGAQRPGVDVDEGGMVEVERSWMRKGEEDTKRRKAMGPKCCNAQLKVQACP